MTGRIAQQEECRIAEGRRFEPGFAPPLTDETRAAYDACARIADDLAQTYGLLTASGCRAVANAIRGAIRHGLP